MIKWIIHKSKNFHEAEEWDILQQILLSAEERQKAAKILRIRAYGAKTPDVREVHNHK